MDTVSMPNEAAPRRTWRLRDLIARRAVIDAALHDMLREQHDLAHRSLGRRRHGDRTID